MSETPTRLLLQVQEYLGSNQLGVEVAPTSKQFPVKPLGLLAMTPVDVVVERPQ